LPNADYQSAGALLRAAQQTAGGVRLEQSAWITTVRRQIPPALFEQSSVKAQRDASIRLRFSADKTVRNVALKAQLAGFSERLHYEDAAVNLVSDLRVHTVLGEASARFDLGKWRLQTALPVQFSVAGIAGANNPTQTRWGGVVTAGRDFFGEKLRTATTLRTEIIDGRTIVLPGESVSWQVLPFLQLRALVQRSYRAPTLQERYYFPGGNRSLLPEEGWSYEGGLSLKKPRTEASNRLATSADFTLFERDIKNWIIWYGGAIWTPHNIARVRTRGFEAEGELRYTAPRLNAGLRSAASYTRATTMESVVARDGSVGSQIPHTPFWNARLGAWLGTARAQLHWNAAYTGFRYITSDESASVPDFFVQNLTLEVPLHLKRMQLRLQARCENVGDVSYVVVAGRPAPGRAFGVLLQVGLE
jgi:iron complex outermembrane receptor protein